MNPSSCFHTSIIPSKLILIMYFRSNTVLLVKKKQCSLKNPTEYTPIVVIHVFMKNTRNIFVTAILYIKHECLLGGTALGYCGDGFRGKAHTNERRLPVHLCDGRLLHKVV